MPEGGGVRGGGGNHEGRGGAGRGRGRAYPGQTRVPYTQHLWALRAHPGLLLKVWKGRTGSRASRSSPESGCLSRASSPSTSQTHCSSRRHHWPQEPW